MAATAAHDTTWAIHPLYAALLASSAPLFLGGLVSDIAYARTYQIQWSNLAAWLIAGGMVFTGLSLLAACLSLLREPGRRGLPLIVLGLLAATFVVGLLDSFIHARDAWGVMPTGLILSVIVTALAVLATWLGFTSLRGRVPA